MQRIGFRCSFANAVNRRGFGKPNEDRLICDAENGFFAVFDGVTRPHGEYTGEGSVAADVSQLICDSLAAEAETIGCAGSVADCEERLRGALLRANGRVAAYNAGGRWQYPPAAVGIAAALCGDSLVFAYAGDCAGFLVRGGARIEFSRRQTEGAKLRGFTKQEMYALARNNAENPAGYGLFDGNGALADLLVVSHLRVEPGDTVYLCSDGVYAFLKYGDPAGGTDAAELLRASAPYDAPPYADYADDKALIVLAL